MDPTHKELMEGLIVRLDKVVANTAPTEDLAALKTAKLAAEAGWRQCHEAFLAKEQELKLSEKAVANLHDAWRKLQARYDDKALTSENNYRERCSFERSLRKADLENSALKVDFVRVQSERDALAGVINGQSDEISKLRTRCANREKPNRDQHLKHAHKQMAEDLEAATLEAQRLDRIIGEQRAVIRSLKAKLRWRDKRIAELEPKEEPDGN